MRMPIDDKEEAKFSMAPMIDMVFLLLVFFMTASHLTSQDKMPIDVPAATRGVVPKERPNRWIVNITTNGLIYSGEVNVSVEQLQDIVAERVKTEPDVTVYLRADAHSDHRETKKVMNAMAVAGIDKFIFGVYTPSENLQQQEAGVP